MFPAQLIAADVQIFEVLCFNLVCLGTLLQVATATHE